MVQDQVQSRRQKLQAELVSALGSTNVYFQPPESVKMRYPCIVYQRERGSALNANDALYYYKKSYTVTVIDANPDSEIPDRILKIPYCSFNRFFTADNLNHWTYTIYY